MKKAINNALIYVSDFTDLDGIIKLLHQNGVRIFSEGKTVEFIKSMNIPVTVVEDILCEVLDHMNYRENRTVNDKFNIPDIDLVVVDLSPFEEIVKSDTPSDEIYEKIESDAIYIINAAAKNFKNTVIVTSRFQYKYLREILKYGAMSIEEDRQYLAGEAFATVRDYYTTVVKYFSQHVSNLL